MFKFTVISKDALNALDKRVEEAELDREILQNRINGIRPAIDEAAAKIERLEKTITKLETRNSALKLKLQKAETREAHYKSLYEAMSARVKDELPEGGEQ